MDDFNKTHELKEINKLRSLLGMKLIKPILKQLKRICLSCDKKFSSEGNYNRMCDECRKLGK